VVSVVFPPLLTVADVGATATEKPPLCVVWLELPPVLKPAHPVRQSASAITAAA